jgi:hypothetical protein
MPSTEAVPTRDSVLKQFRPGFSETDTRDFMELGPGAVIFAMPPRYDVHGQAYLAHLDLASETKCRRVMTRAEARCLRPLLQHFARTELAESALCPGCLGSGRWSPAVGAAIGAGAGSSPGSSASSSRAAVPGSGARRLRTWGRGWKRTA